YPNAGGSEDSGGMSLLSLRLKAVAVARMTHPHRNSRSGSLVRAMAAEISSPPSSPARAAVGSSKAKLSAETQTAHSKHDDCLLFLILSLRLGTNSSVSLSTFRRGRLTNSCFSKLGRAQPAALCLDRRTIHTVAGPVPPES